jgi:multiple sugar transport system ATP-binding protein
MAAVSLTSVSKRFSAVQAVDKLTLDIADGEFFVLLGPTGAGKTTTLRLVAGLEAPDAGRVSIGGADVTDAPPAARNVAFVFQQYSLYPHLTVYENLAFPLRSPLRRQSEEAIRTRIHEVARILRIEDKLDNSATRLSGGQMQRVAIGRALVRAPAVYLMDEPLSSLDAKLRGDLRLELKHIQHRLGATMLYVTHDQIEAMTMADRIGVMGNGCLIQTGSPRDIYASPRNIYVATRLGQPAINLLPAGTVPVTGLMAGTTQVGARTEHVRLVRASDATNALGRIEWIEHLGDQNHMHVALKGASLVILVDPDAGFEVGDSVGVMLDRPLCFDADGERIRHERIP